MKTVNTPSVSPNQLLAAPSPFAIQFSIHNSDGSCLSHQRSDQEPESQLGLLLVDCHFLSACTSYSQVGFTIHDMNSTLHPGEPDAMLAGARATSPYSGRDSLLNHRLL